MVFKETEGNVHMYERIYRFLSRWIRKKEKYANSKWVLRNLFCWRSNESNNEKISLTWKRVQPETHSRHGDPAMPLISPPNDVWETSAEIPWRLYPDLGSSSDWLNQISHSVRPIRITTQFWVVTRRHYGISELVFQTFFRGETSGGVVKCRLFSQASVKNDIFRTEIGSGFGEFPGIPPGK